MELTDVARVLARYRWLVVGMVAAAAALAALSHIGESRTYTASARLALDAPDPESRAEAAAVADTAKALATSPSQVRAALRKANATSGDPDELAREHVSVRALGSSAIVQLSVTLTRPRVAAAIANALAAQVIESRLRVTKGEIEDVLAALDGRLSRINRRISALEGRIASLTAEAASGSPSSRSRLNEAERSRDLLGQQRSVVEAQRVSLLSSEALRPKAAIVSRATPPTTADPSRVLPDMLLAAIIALILAVGIAGVAETIRRNVVGGAAIARAFDTPLLGTVRASLAHERAFDSDPGVALRLVLAAEASGVTDITLFPIGRPVDTGALAERLQAATADAIRAPYSESFAENEDPGHRRVTSTAGFAPRAHRAHAGGESPVLSIRPFGAPASSSAGRTGLIVVSPGTLTKGELQQAVQLVDRTPLPLIGLIAIDAIPAQPARAEESLRARLERLRRSA